MTEFEKIWIIDGSTLEALFKKLPSLEEERRGQLAGKMSTVIDLMTRLPREIWFEENPQASDTLTGRKYSNFSNRKYFTIIGEKILPL